LGQVFGPKCLAWPKIQERRPARGGLEARAKKLSLRRPRKAVFAQVQKKAGGLCRVCLGPEKGAAFFGASQNS